MVAAVEAGSLDELIDEAVPQQIRLTKPLDVPGPETETQFLSRIQAVGGSNRPGRPFIGLGYYGCFTPSVILRNVFENPGWYTPYTPYQAEVAQGRLEALLNFQTMVADLTGMPVANASLLDEATAAAEAMALLHRAQTRARPGANRFLLSSGCFPHTIDVVRGRAEPLEITIDVGESSSWSFDESDCEDVFGILLQYPAQDGEVEAIDGLIEQAHAARCPGGRLQRPVGTDPVDSAGGTRGRCGGRKFAAVRRAAWLRRPHAAFFATRTEFARQTPGRIIGLSVDRHGDAAHRMSLQTREQQHSP